MKSLQKYNHWRAVETISTINYNENPEWDLEVLKLNTRVDVDVVLEDGGTLTLLRSLNVIAKRRIVGQIEYLRKTCIQKSRVAYCQC